MKRPNNRSILHLIVAIMAKALSAAIIETIKNLVLAFLNTSPMKQGRFSAPSSHSERKLP